MLCRQCGQELSPQDRFCNLCGTPVAVPRKKARLWPAVVTLVLIFAVGLSVFLLMRPDRAATPPAVSDEAAPWFTLENGVLYFDKNRYTGGSELTVPKSINGQIVTALAEECFAYCDALVMIYLPETLTSIGDSAFYGCSSLRGIRLPDRLLSIGDYAFGGCINLEAVCIPYSLRQFGESIYSNCHKLVYFFYPGPLSHWHRLSMGEIPDNSFVYCADGIYPAK